MILTINNKRDLPLFRGRIHILNLFSLPILAFSVLKNHEEHQIIIGYFIFFSCCLFNLFASSLLHFKIWEPKTMSLFKRIDYAGIFLVIGSSAFPSILMYMKNDKILMIFSLVHWTIIFAGVFGSLLFEFTKTSKSFRSIVYPFFGFPYLYFGYILLVNRKYFSLTMSALTVVLYITGSVFYATESPNLIPGIFEFHELFHLFCWMAFIASFFLNYHLTREKTQFKAEIEVNRADERGKESQNTKMESIGGKGMGLSVLDRMRKHDRKVPLLRGRIHVLNFLLHLYYVKNIPPNTSPPLKMAHCITLAVSVVNTLITVCYHNTVLSDENRSLVKRVDYAVIFLTIPASYLPMYIYLISDDFTLWFVIVQWIFTFTGVFCSLIYDFCMAPKPVRVTGFVTLGLFNLFLFYEYGKSGEFLTLFYLVSGNVLYFIGAVIYSSKFPNLVPRIFEHHELMHLLVILGNLFTFKALLTVP